MNSTSLGEIDLIIITRNFTVGNDPARNILRANNGESFHSLRSSRQDLGFLATTALSATFLVLIFLWTPGNSSLS
jgi:hypothetical protein